jgi:DNA-binding beta-propeller fold protein YncE
MPGRTLPSTALLALLAGTCAAQTIRVVSLTTNRIAYNPVDGMIYGTGPSSAGAPAGNSITPISTATATLGASVFMGSEPNQLAISDSGRYIYVGLGGTGAVRRFDTTTQSAGLEFSLGSGSLSLHYVDDIEVQPGNESVVAISRRNQGFSPRHEGVAIYENGVMRPTTTPGHTGANVIAFSESPEVLYGYNNETTEYGVRRISVSPSGATVAQTYAGLISGFGVDIKYAAGHIYSTSGRKIHAASGTIVGSFPTTGLVEPDQANGRVYFLASSGTPRILRVYDLESFLEIGSVSIPQVTSAATVTDLLRWGSDGLAFRTSTGQVVLINTALVNPNATGPCCLPSGVCSTVTLAACNAVSGFWRGPDLTCATASCPPPGACCMADGTCTISIQPLCGGVWTSGASCGVVNCPPPTGPHVIRIVPLATNRLVYNPADGNVYASIAGVSGFPRGNSITPIHAATAAVGTSVFVGSDPSPLAISQSGQSLYAGLSGSGAVRRFNTSSQTAGLQFSLGAGFSSANYVEDIEVQPGSESTVAISRRNQGFSPRHEGVAIYDDGVMRPTTSARFDSTNVIAWSDFPAELYGFNNETTGFQLRRLAVTPAGVSIAQSFSGLISGFGADIKYANGFIYATTGRKINAATMSLAGTYPLSGLIEPDPARGRVYILPTSGSPRILRVYDINTFLEVGTISISGVTSTAAVSDLYRWGENGLVFRTPTQVVLINTTLVPPAPCYPNCDGSTVAPILNVGDFTCFLQRFAAGDSYVNCDGSTVPPVLNVGDFTCFLQRFAAGCP